MSWKLAAQTDKTLDATIGRELGGPRLHVIYESDLWPREVPRSQRIFTAVLDEQYDEIIQAVGNASAVLLDVEQSLGDSPWSGDDQNADTAGIRRGNYITIVQRVKERISLPLGGYNIGVPIWGRLGPQERRNQVERYAQGQYTIVRELDFICASLYCRWESDFEDWTRRYADTAAWCKNQWNLPLLGLLWPQYHDAHTSKPLERIPWFLESVEWSHRNCDLTAVWAMRGTSQRIGDQWIEESRLEELDRAEHRRLKKQDKVLRQFFSLANAQQGER